MQDIVFYAAANETLGVVRDYANSRNEYAPTLVLGVSVCLRMRLFAGSESAAPFPVDSFSGITSWKWRMDSDFDRETPYKLNADSNGISVQTVTDTIDGETLSFTEFAIQISDMNTLELATWLGTEKKKTGLTGELVGYDSSGNAVFVLQIDDFTVRNRLAGLNEPTSNDQEYLTRSETENLVSSAVAAKQDKLTSANAGEGITIDSGGTISLSSAILGGTNGVQLVNGVTQMDTGDGLLVEAGRIAIDDASVADVIAGIEGGTASINDEVVTPGNLRGALSIGQAVDVSCKPYNNSGSIVYVNNDFLQGFTCSMVSGTTVGFYDATTHKFPKFADDLVYLFLADVSGSGVITPNGGSAITLSGRPQRITMKVTANNSGFFSASASATVNVANWRQYEVTALTDEAVEFLGSTVSNPNPDRLFRSTSTANVINRYLVKQDMVCPWIKIIGMPDNSDFTVAAGLSYKIRYTNDNAHKITVDTIPQDAYGKDAHIQMFIKGASSVQFQPPLILMEALKPNAGHNLTVKFRDGSAYVYVDDLNAGYLVVFPTGSTEGTLAYGLTMTPANASDDKYIIFGSTVNGAVCDFGTVTAVYGSQSTIINMIGNGSNLTSVGGTLTVPSGKTVNIQELAVTGSSINGAGTVDFTNAAIENSVLDVSTLKVHDVKINGTLRTKAIDAYGNIGSDELGYVTDLYGSGQDQLVNPKVSGCTVSNLVIEGATTSNAIFNTRFDNPWTLSINNCLLKDNLSVTGNGCVFYMTGLSTVSLTGTTISGGTAKTANLAGNGGMVNGNSSSGYAELYAKDCTWINNYIQIQQGSKVRSYFSGRITLNDTYIASGKTEVFFADNTVIDVSGTLRYGARDRILSRDDANCDNINIGNNVSFITVSGVTMTLDACTCGYITFGGIFHDYRGSITVSAAAADPWRAVNVIFRSPLDAHNASTIQLSGTTFTSGSMISSPPARIQLPGGSTNSFAGNTTSDGTTILQASVIVVGINPATPSGSATIVASGATPKVSGIGTYIAKDGSNDFTTLSNVNSVTVSSGASTVASSLASALALTTSAGGQNRWVKLANNLTATAAYTNGAAVSDKRILTAEYEPVLAGNFSLSSGAVMTVNEATRTTTIASAAMVMSSVEIPSGATLRVSGGGLTIESMSGAGGTIELAGSNAFQMTGGTIGRVVVSSGAVINLTSSIVPGCGITVYGGGSLSPTMIVCGGSSRIFEDVEIRGTTITDQGIIYGATVYSNVGDDHYVYFTGDGGATSSSVIVTGATEYVVSGGLVRIVGT